MTIAVRSYTSANGTGSLTQAIPVPAGTINGDVLVLQASSYNLCGVTDPPGWNHPINASLSIVNSFGFALYWRKAASEPASYTLTWNNTTRTEALMVCLSGCDLTAPFDINATSATSSSVSPATGSLTTSNGNEMLLALFAYKNNSAYTDPGGMSAVGNEVSTYNVGSQVTMAVSSLLQTPSGASGAKTATIGVSTQWIASLLAFKPSVVFWQRFLKSGEVDL